MQKERRNCSINLFWYKPILFCFREIWVLSFFQFKRTSGQLSCSLTEKQKIELDILLGVRKVRRIYKDKLEPIFSNFFSITVKYPEYFHTPEMGKGGGTIFLFSATTLASWFSSSSFVVTKFSNGIVWTFV